MHPAENAPYALFLVWRSRGTKVPTASLIRGVNHGLRYPVHVDLATQALLGAVTGEESSPKPCRACQGCSRKQESVAACPHCNLVGMEVISTGGQLLRLERVVGVRAIGPIERQMVLGCFLSEDGQRVFNAGYDNRFGWFNPIPTIPVAERLKILATSAFPGITREKIASLLRRIRREYGSTLLAEYGLSIVVTAICSTNRFEPTIKGRCVYPPKEALGFRLLRFGHKSRLDQVYLIDHSGIIALGRD